MSLISIFESLLSFSFVFKASPNINANASKAGGSSSLRVSHGGSCVGFPLPLHTKSFSVPLPPPSCLPQH